MLKETLQILQLVEWGHFLFCFRMANTSRETWQDDSWLWWDHSLMGGENKPFCSLFPINSQRRDFSDLHKADFWATAYQLTMLCLIILYY